MHRILLASLKGAGREADQNCLNSVVSDLKLSSTVSVIHPMSRCSANLFTPLYGESRSLEPQTSDLSRETSPASPAASPTQPSGPSASPAPTSPLISGRGTRKHQNYRRRAG